MARSRKTIKKRPRTPDPIYGNRLVGRFINQIMRDGKKTIAQGLMYKTFAELEDKGHKDPVQAFEEALQKIGPRMEVKPRRIGGASYQVPIEVKGERRISLAMRWLKEAASKRSNKEFPTFSDKLSAEISAAVKDEGEAVNKRNTVHKTAKANKAFSHFRW